MGRQQEVGLYRPTRAKPSATDSPGGGDRAAINALHRVDLVRMSNDVRTRAYVIRQLANGRTKRDVVRLRNAPSPARCSDSPPMMRHRRLPRLSARPPNQKHHPDCSRRSLRRLAHRHLPTRTRTPTQRPNRHQLSPMAQRRLTNTIDTNRSISIGDFHAGKPVEAPVEAVDRRRDRTRLPDRSHDCKTCTYFAWTV